MSCTSEYAIEMWGITKRYLRVLANEDVDFSVRSATIHALIGENGAGKSTLMKILAGLVRPTSGTIRVEGEPLRPGDPAAALSRGIGMVQQHSTLIPRMTVAENVVLGAEPRWGPFVRTREAARAVRTLCHELDLAVEPDRTVERLSVGERHRAELLKVLYRGARIGILDEPTAALVPQERDALFALMRRLRDRGVTVVLITHKLPEVRAVADRVTVMRRGRMVGEWDVRDTTEGELARAMIGSRVLPSDCGRIARPYLGHRAKPRLSVRGTQADGRQDADRHRQVPGRDAGGAGQDDENPVLTVDRLCTDRAYGVPLDEVSFSLRVGEILGVAGVAGNGQSELVGVLTGRIEIRSGEIHLEGKSLTRSSPREIRDSGVAHIPEDGPAQGLMMDHSVAENLILGIHRQRPFGRGWALDPDAIRRYASSRISEFDIRPPDPEGTAGALSGGNQQRVIVAREISQCRVLLVASHPTRGLDLASTRFVHRRVCAERDRGAAVLLISSDLEELLELCDRILVMYQGRVAGIVRPSESDERQLGLLMTGGASDCGLGIGECGIPN